MPPPFLFDISTLDPDHVVLTKEQIYEVLPHRYEMMQLDAIIYNDMEHGVAAARRDVRSDEFWVRGHIPGRPLLPGVLMIESAAQLASFFAMKCLNFQASFLGFGGVDKVKFRESVSPGQRLIILAQMLESRTRRIVFSTQGVVDGRIAFEAIITGMPI